VNFELHHHSYRPPQDPQEAAPLQMELRFTLAFFSSQEQRFWLKEVAPENMLNYMMNKATKQMSVMKEKKLIVPITPMYT
jgi:hypothetical protein